MDTKNQAWLEKGLGKQLLLKMGWKEGEGLGVDGQGRKGNVTVRKVTEQRGLGFNSQNEGDAGIVKQIHGLNDVLASLKADHAIATEETKSTKSKKSSRRKAEEEVDEGNDDEEASNKKSRKSKRKAESGDSASEQDSSVSDKEEERETKGTYKSSKRRRGYKKFLDAKDVSRYSKQDLKAILGGVII